ncbi:MAG TPA: hypothetical protein VK427_20895, partial [Kofleriaceae bacterium]|nr:hypothetical protein [Kofleriaceae bacterium]
MWRERSDDLGAFTRGAECRGRFDDVGALGRAEPRKDLSEPGLRGAPRGAARLGPRQHAGDDRPRAVGLEALVEDELDRARREARVEVGQALEPLVRECGVRGRRGDDALEERGAAARCCERERD